eukprot:CAMPEP_0198284758 /NCGR_PEP_ID=MMETSP1449-20131203/4199_1 /TAXON_ID=420275 /ORGANISM="Attheya septentrionalis, Strain CCMP2084" /LENGTH=464 /DNA_ID=CAMNT_0043981971 /DNA_START=45 /DNA_END=1439 /DNA_ORIENTATION=+
MLLKPSMFAREMRMVHFRSSRRCISATTVNSSAEVKPNFYVPKAERKTGNRNVFTVDAKMGEARLLRNDRRCPTRELNFTPESWGKHKDPYRRLRHIANTFRSSPLQRLAFPDLFGVTMVSFCLTYYNEFIAYADAMATVSSAGFAGGTTVIGLLAGFRLNASYGRYEECRIFWGDINNSTRDLAGQTMMWMKDANQRSRMLKLLKAFPVSLMFHLHAKGCHHNILRRFHAPTDEDRDYADLQAKEHAGEIDTPHHNVTRSDAEFTFEDRVHAEFLAELRDIYSDGKDEEDFQRFNKVKYGGGNTPLEVLTCMRETIAGSIDTVDPVYVRELDEQCQRLCAAFGASERVLRTPLPTGFTRHSSRLMFIWSHTLPFALYPAMGPLLTLPTAVLTAYAVLGVEDIGVQLEEPFDILPLRQYSDGMYDAVSAVERNYTPYVIKKETPYDEKTLSERMVDLVNESKKE